MQVFQEQDRIFSFPDTWQVLHYDEGGFRREHMSQYDAVDFVAIHPDGKLFMIEVKDFRGYSIQNRDKILNGDLYVSIGKKVVATVAGLMIGHCRKNLVSYSPFASLLSVATSQIRIIALVEHDYPQRHPCALSLASNRIKAHIRWLDGAHAFVLNGSRLESDYGIQVRNRARRP